MHMVRKTKEEALETRHQILDAAENVFLTQGVSRTSLQQVAAAAGLTRGAIYWHFKDKAALFDAMMERVILPCEVTLTEALEAPNDQALEGLKNSALLPLSALTQNDQMVRVFRIAMHLTEYTEELASVQHRHQTSVDNFIQKLETLLVRAQQAGLVSADSAAHSIAIGLFALIDGLMRRWTLAPGSFDLVPTGEQNLNALLAGLTPR